MKQLLSILSLLTTFSAVCQSPSTPLGQQVTPVSDAFKAPAIVTSRFGSDYPDSPATWRKIGEESYAADMMDKKTNSKKTVVYDSFGNLLYTDSQLKRKEYPKQIKSHADRNFPDEEFEVWFHETSDKQQSYFITVKNDTISFDKNGTAMQRKDRHKATNHSGE